MRALETAGTAATATGYLLGMGAHDFDPDELHPPAATAGGGGGSLYYGVHLLAQQPPCT